MLHLRPAVQSGRPKVCRGSSARERPGLGQWYAQLVYANRGSAIPENPVSILSSDVMGCEWFDGACIRLTSSHGIQF